MNIELVIENRRRTYEEYTGKKLSNEAFIAAIESALNAVAMKDLETYIIRDIGSKFAKDVVAELKKTLPEPKTTLKKSSKSESSLDA
jgi:Holliday junction resolvasome RuvABC DNA-binding subunit